jgi:ubiquinone biosynthesis protein COQ4
MKTPFSQQYDFPRAGRAIAALLRNPDDLPQVFTIIESMSGNSMTRLLLRVRRSESGARLLRDQPDVVQYLSDRAWLRSLKEGSLGRAYLEFVESEGISAEGILKADERSQVLPSRDLEYVRCRMRDTHDLWHTVTGYKGDVRGEVALLAFELSQIWHNGIAAVMLTALVKRYCGPGGLKLTSDAYRRGRAAAEWFPAVEWEKLLPLPLQDVRARLGLDAPRAWCHPRQAPGNEAQAHEKRDERGYRVARVD